MQNKIKKYLILICIMGGVVLHGIVWSETHPARALSPASGTELVQVQVISSENTITLDYSIPGATLTSLDEESPCPKGTCTKTRVRAGNASQKDREGEPVIPVIPSRVIIPAGKAIDNINVTRSGEFEHEGEYFLEYGGKARVISDTTPYEPAMPDESIYYSDNPFPGITHEIVNLQKKCGVSIAYINIFPVTYYPLSGRVISYSSISLYVNLKEAGAQSVYDIACYPERVNPERKGIENPDALESYTPEYCQQVRDALPTGGICDPSETYEYVVITTEDLDTANPPEFPLSDLIEWREGPLGGQLSVKVVTVDDPDPDNSLYYNIAYDYGDHNDQDPAEDSLVKIRNFIRDAYNNWQTEYVLIIGDPNFNNEDCIVPMRGLWGREPGGADTTVCSDLYYQCLDSAYNPDGDDYWGEYYFLGDGYVDLESEVNIGRACVETPTELSNFIGKTIKYEESVIANDPYLDRVSLLGEWLATFPDGELYSKPFMERIRLGDKKANTFGFISSPFSDIDVLYDQEETWSKDDIIRNFNEIHYGIMNHLGHGGEGYLLRLITGEIALLNNGEYNKFPFLYSQACLAGNPRVSSIGERITTSTEHGVWGAVLNTHKGLVSHTPNLDNYCQLFNKSFWHGYFYEGIFNVGALHAYSLEENIPAYNDNKMYWVYYVNNLFGDPYTQFKDPIPCERNLSNLNFAGLNYVSARKLITTGENVSITSLPGTDVTFVSGEEIRLGPGLHISNGAEFKAYIDPILYKSYCD